MKVPPLTSMIGVLLSLVVGAFTGVGGYTFYYAEGSSYLSNDPRACVNCHIMREQYDGWQHASHHAVATCNDCHVPHDLAGKWLTKASNGFHHSRAFTFQNFHEPIRIRPVNRDVLNANCTYCHGGVTSQIRNLPRTASAPAHAESEPMDCVRCHDAVGHGPSR